MIAKANGIKDFRESCNAGFTVKFMNPKGLKLGTVVTVPNWVVPRADPGVIRELAAALRIQPLTARVLLSRGLGDAEAARRFLVPSIEHLHDPALLAGVPEAVERLRGAIGRREK